MLNGTSRKLLFSLFLLASPESGERCFFFFFRCFWLVLAASCACHQVHAIWLHMNRAARHSKGWHLCRTKLPRNVCFCSNVLRKIRGPIWLDDRGTGQWKWLEEVPRRTSLVPLAFPCFVLRLIGLETKNVLDYQGRAGDHFHCTVERSPGHIRCRKMLQQFPKMLGPFFLQADNFPKNSRQCSTLIACKKARNFASAGWAWTNIIRLCSAINREALSRNNLSFACLGLRGADVYPPRAGLQQNGPFTISVVDSSVPRRGGRNKGGHKQMRANANKRRQTLTNASKRRGDPLHCSFFTPPFAIPLTLSMLGRHSFFSVDFAARSVHQESPTTLQTG